MLKRDHKIADLTAELEIQVKLNLALAKENDALREQAQVDRGIIESLSSQDNCSKIMGLGMDACGGGSSQPTSTDKEAAESVTIAQKQPEAAAARKRGLGNELVDLSPSLQLMADKKKEPAHKEAISLLDSSMAFLQAAEKGDIASFTEMLNDETFMEVNAVTEDRKESALHKAALGGHCEIGRLLLRKLALLWC